MTHYLVNVGGKHVTIPINQVVGIVYDRPVSEKKRNAAKNNPWAKFIKRKAAEYKKEGKKLNLKKDSKKLKEEYKGSPEGIAAAQKKYQKWLNSPDRIPTQIIPIPQPPVTPILAPSLRPPRVQAQAYIPPPGTRLAPVGKGRKIIYPIHVPYY